MSAIVVVTPPSTEPVSLGDLKLFCRVDSSNTVEDSLITALGKAAREYCETFTRRAFITTVFRQSLDCFPSYYGHGSDPYTVSFPRRSAVYELIAASQIKLYRPPLVEVDSIEYKDRTGAIQTLTEYDVNSNPDGVFMVDQDNEPAVVFPAPGKSWPTDQLLIPNNVKITFTSGYGADSTSVPESIKTAIKQLTAHWFEHRESVSEDNLKEVPQAVDMLLTQYRVLDFAYTNG
jgi:uncharacterized phiE125 gp8 family phage protein